MKIVLQAVEMLNTLGAQHLLDPGGPVASSSTLTLSLKRGSEVGHYIIYR